MIVETSARFLWLPHASRKKREVIKDRLDVLKCTVSSIFFFYIGALTRDPLRDLWVVGGGDRCKGGKGEGGSSVNIHLKRIQTTQTGEEHFLLKCSNQNLKNKIKMVIIERHFHVQ